MPKLSVGETFSCSFSGYQKSLEKSGGGGRIKIFPLNFLSHFLKISVGESFTVALFSDCEKVWRRGGGEGYEDLTSRTFCLTVPKISLGNSSLLHCFRVPKKFG